MLLSFLVHTDSCVLHIYFCLVFASVYLPPQSNRTFSCEFEGIAQEVVDNLHGACFVDINHEVLMGRLQYELQVGRRNNLVCVVCLINYIIYVDRFHYQFEFTGFQLCFLHHTVDHVQNHVGILVDNLAVFFSFSLLEDHVFVGQQH